MDSLVPYDYKNSRAPRVFILGIWCEIIELTFEAKKAFFGTLVALLVVYSSFKNLAQASAR